MKFSQRLSVRYHSRPAEFARGIWNPQMNLWRDVLQDYLYISNKRFNNKLCMFKLQLHILQDIITNIVSIDKYNEKEIILENDKYKKDNSNYENEVEFIHTEIFRLEIINKVLREIIDGVVWKYLKYNRAILYMLADKEPVETIRINKGTINNLYQFADVLLEPESVAIFNDITNFLRVGDVTQINNDGSIEIIEVKSSKKIRGKRITRQKKRMTELVKFFNTGIKEYDGKTLKIIDSNIRQKNYLSQLYDAIKKARYRGYESLLIGNYLIVQIIDYSKVKDIDEVINTFSSKHKSVQDNWKRQNDFVFPAFFIDKMNYSKNCAPFSIYPFDIETCTDIMTGKLWITVLLNCTEISRIIEKKDWKIIDSFFTKSVDEIAKLEDITKVASLSIQKNGLTIKVPPSIFARMQFELLNPQVIIDEFEETLDNGPQADYDLYLTNYLDEKNIWKL